MCRLCEEVHLRLKCELEIGFTYKGQPHVDACESLSGLKHTLTFAGVSTNHYLFPFVVIGGPWPQ